MRPGLYLHFFWLFLIPVAVPAQEYSYTHYGIADGLPSATTYSITQDRDGFIWVATEAGVSRFDGVHFRTFTSEDGLNDIEALQLFADSRGRVWMAPFRGSVCYYFQGKIHNQQNDSLLAAIPIKNAILNFAEDAGGDILIQEKTALSVVRRDGTIRHYDSASGMPITKCVACSKSSVGHFMVQIGTGLFHLSDSGLTEKMHVQFPFDHPLYAAMSPSWAVFRPDTFHTRIRSLLDGNRSDLPFYSGGYMVTTHISYSILDDSLLFMNQYSGSVEYDLRAGAVRQFFLPGKQVSRAFRAEAGNIWFTTIGDGIYRLNSQELKTIVLPRSGIGVSSVHAIAVNRKGDRLLVGDNHNVLFSLRLPDLKIMKSKPINHFGANRLLFIHQFNDNLTIIASDASIAVETVPARNASWFIAGIKSAVLAGPERVLVGGAWGAGLYDVGRERLIDTLWRGRITAVYNQGDTNYIGTLHGLWRIIGRGKPRFLGDLVPKFRNRIAAI